ncbi:MAG TPA: hypothetical protein VFN20_10765 [Candidatus Acidoferrum sp.]|nr:hypothetical protein [Candidatus Acidoferrum sp.]
MCSRAALLQVAGAKVSHRCALAAGFPHGCEILAGADLAPQHLGLGTGGVGRPGRAMLTDRKPARPAGDISFEDLDLARALAAYTEAAHQAVPGNLTRFEALDNAHGDARRGLRIRELVGRAHRRAKKSYEKT